MTDLADRAARTAAALYEGREVRHRSCGICLAATFGLPTRPYQALRRGGISGEDACGAIEAGKLILGELLGDPDPAGAVTERLRAAMSDYRRACGERIARGGSPDLVCANLTRPLGEFGGEVRRRFCTTLVSDVARIVAEVLLAHGARVEIAKLPKE